MLKIVYSWFLPFCGIASQVMLITHLVFQEILAQEVDQSYT